MINLDEHKKLLEQITELEKNSVNYFDVEKEFFLIDSDNLPQVRPKFYGYSIQRTGIYEEDNLTAEAIAGLDGRGCYVYVEVKDGKITIKQDLNGSWGIYLFRHGDYFALSNSFFRLLDHVKFKYPLTVNRDYCNHHMLSSYSSYSYSETTVNEIRLLERNAIIHIDKEKRTLETELIDYKEYSISLDSDEGMETLDRWVEFWGYVLRGVARHTNFIQVNLSGGFDSRANFALVLNSGIDLNKIRVFSKKADYHTFKDDYEIASKIATHYGFKLNQPFPEDKAFLNLTLSDIFNLNLYTCQTFSNLPKMISRKLVNKTYSLGGSSVDSLRGYWYTPPKEFIKNTIQFIPSCSLSLSRELSGSIETILNSAFRVVQDKYNIKDSDSKYIPQYMTRDTVCRHHYGKSSIPLGLMNNFSISVAVDPEVRTLKLSTSECPDPNLLIAVLFTRHAPELLTFPFDSGHRIAPETIEYAKKLNERFPLGDKKQPFKEEEFHMLPRDENTEKILAQGRNNKLISTQTIQSCLEATFESSRNYGLFSTYFSTELYNMVFEFYKNPLRRYRLLYAILGVTRTLADVEISQRNNFLYKDTYRYLNQDFYQVHTEGNMPDKFKPYLTSRIDIKLMTTEGDFQILSVSDSKAEVTKPGWMQQNLIGYLIQSYTGQLGLRVKANVDGEIQLMLRAMDIRDQKDNAKSIPYWIDYTKLTVDDKTIFDKITPVWCNQFYMHKINAKAGEEILIQVEWQPHRSDT